MIVWLDTARAEVMKVAFPLVLSVAVPSVTSPSLKVTVPEGLPLPGAVTPTVAVNVTAWPNVEVVARRLPRSWSRPG